MSGCTGGHSANRGGISIMALLMSTATGFRSPAKCGEPEPLGLQRDGAASGEGV